MAGQDTGENRSDEKMHLQREATWDYRGERKMGSIRWESGDLYNFVIHTNKCQVHNIIGLRI